MKFMQDASRPDRRSPRALGLAASVRAVWAIVIVAWLVILSGMAAQAAEPSTRPATAPATSATDEPADVPATRPASAPTTGPARILLNFKDASLQAVLEYLSESAGLIILDGTSVEGRVTVMSRQPVTTEEAVAVLDTILKDKGYAAIRTGRTLKIVPVADAAKENLPVFSGNDPSKVPMTDRLVTQIIPIRRADATTLKTDLAPVIGVTATLTANKLSNSLILIDTQTRIRRIMQIIRALDESMASVTEVKIYRLKYADATATSTLITNMFRQDTSQQSQSPFMRFGVFTRRGRGGRGSQQSDAEGGPQQKVTAAADARTNTLVVSAPADVIRVIDGIIEELDSDPTEEQSVFVYPLKNAQAANLQTVLNQIFSESTGTTRSGARGRGQTRGRFSMFGRAQAATTATGAGDLAGQVYVIADEDTNSLLVRTATKHVTRIKEILAELDRPTRQVLIKVLIAEVTHDSTFDLGTEFSVLNLRFGAAGTFTLDLGGTLDDMSGGLITSTVDTGLSATFNALQRDGRLDVLSRPYILASDNKEATITIGQEVPFIRNSRTTETGQTINNIEYEDVGIILTVTPHVNPDGLVIMSVSPEISSISDTVVPISETVNAMVVNKRSATTEVAVQDGQTIVIGGLMEDRISDSVRKVPFLGDIPLIGGLFRRTTKVKIKTELLIFLTPRVARTPKDLQPISKDETSDMKAVQGAGEHGAFEEHMKAMHRGATTRPAGDKDETRP